MDQDEPFLLRVSRVPVLMPIKVLFVAMKKSELVRAQRLLVLVSVVDSFELVSEHLLSAQVHDEHVVGFFSQLNLVNKILVHEQVSLEASLNLLVVQNVVMGHLERQAAEQVTLLQISYFLIEQQLDHLWVSESACLVHRIVSELVRVVHLAPQDPLVGRIVIVLDKEHLNDLQLVVLNRRHERRALVFFLGHER